MGKISGHTEGKGETMGWGMANIAPPEWDMGWERPSWRGGETPGLWGREQEKPPWTTMAIRVTPGLGKGNERALGMGCAMWETSKGR